MRKYLKIIKILLKNSYIRDSKIPGFVISGFLFNSAEIVVTIVFFDVIFNNIQSLGGWTFYQLLFLYMVAKVIASINNIFTKAGINEMIDNLVRRGGLDFYLVKPVDPMILVSISKPKIYATVNVIFELSIMAYALLHSGVSLNLLNVILFLILFVLGTILFYFLRWSTVIPVFWFIRLWSLRDIMGRMTWFSRYPAEIFPGFLKFILFIAFPVMAVSYIPVSTLFYQPRIEFIIYMLLITLAFGVLAKMFWNFGLKHYASASS